MKTLSTLLLFILIVLSVGVQGQISGKQKKKVGEKPESGNSQPTRFPEIELRFNNPDFRDFPVFSYKGLPLLWHKNDFPEGTITQADIGNNASWEALIRINVLESLYRQKIREYEKVKPYNNITPFNVYANDLLRNGLITYFLSEKGRQTYFGDAKQPGYKWGGSFATEFVYRKTYETFMNSAFDKFINIVSNQHLEMYTMHAMELPAYNFDKKGFMLSVPVRNDYEIDFPSNINRNTLVKGIFFSIPPADAEALINRLKSKPSHTNAIYAVYKKEFIKTNRALNKLRFNEKRLLNRITDPVVELYEDPWLTKKLGEINLSPLIKETNDYKDISFFAGNSMSLIDFESKNEMLKSFKVIGYKGLPLIGNVTEDISFAFFPPGTNSIKYTYFVHLLNIKRMDEIIKKSSTNEKPAQVDSNQIYKSIYTAGNDLLSEEGLNKAGWKYGEQATIAKEYLDKITALDLRKSLWQMAGNTPLEAYLLTYKENTHISTTPPGKFNIDLHAGVSLSDNGILSKVKKTGTGYKYVEDESVIFPLTPEIEQIIKKPLSAFEQDTHKYGFYLVQKIRIVPIFMQVGTYNATHYIPDRQRHISFFPFEADDELEIFEDMFLTKKITTIKLGR